MKSITFFVLAALSSCLLMAPAANGQVDPDPDGIGIYFDTAATVVVTTASAGEVVTAYLIGTRLSQSGEIDYWGTRLCPVGGAAIGGAPRGSYNYATNMPGDPCWSCVALEPDPALLAGEITILADLQIEVWDTLIPIGLHVSGNNRYSLAGSPVEHALYPSSGASDLPVAMINGEAPVAVETGSWSRIKAIYR